MFHFLSLQCIHCVNKWNVKPSILNNGKQVLLKNTSFASLLFGKDCKYNYNFNECVTNVVAKIDVLFLSYGFNF